MEIGQNDYPTDHGSFFSTSPLMVFYVLSEVFPSIHSFLDLRLLEAPFMLYSIANPILYCYRDSRYRKAVLELLRIRKSPATVAVDSPVCYVRGKHRNEEAEEGLKLQNVGKPAACLLTRAASCNLALVPEHGKY